jgi:hypothetical protein
MTSTKAELEAEINRLKGRVAELEGEVKGLQFALKHQPLPDPVPPVNPYAWTWPTQSSPTWEQPVYPVKSIPYVTC